MKTLFEVEPVTSILSPQAQTQMTSQNVPIWALYQNRRDYENYPAFQRTKVWPGIMNQALINTILFGGIVPPIVTLRKITSNGTVHYVIDGQQRLSAIFAFLDGHFRTVTRAAWHTHEPGIEPVEPGVWFRAPKPNVPELSDYAKQIIKQFTLTIYSGEDMDMATASFLFRQLNKHVSLTKAERLNSYQSELLRYAHELSAHPFWDEVYKGDTKRRQKLRGCLYALVMQINQKCVSMSSTPLGIYASGICDKEVSQETLFQCMAKLGQIMHTFKGCTLLQSYEFIPMYQAVLFLEKEGHGFDFVSAGIFSNWFKELQQEVIRSRYNRTASLFQQMENLGYQEDFWNKHLSSLKAIL